MREMVARLARGYHTPIPHFTGLPMRHLYEYEVLLDRIHDEESARMIEATFWGAQPNLKPGARERVLRALQGGDNTSMPAPRSDATIPLGERLGALQAMGIHIHALPSGKDVN